MRKIRDKPESACYSDRKSYDERRAPNEQRSTTERGRARVNMNCRYCQSWNAEDEHRCGCCGRRLTTIASGSTRHPASRSSHALALEHQPSSASAPAIETRAVTNQLPVPQRFSFDDAPESNIIPFESFAADRIQPFVRSVPVARERRSTETRKAPGAKSEPRRRSVTQPQNDLQPGLDFLVPPPHGPRTLKTQVEAVIYCDAAVASPKHRAIASALDGGMIFIGFGAFLFTFHLMGGMFHLNRQTIPFFIGVFGTLALFYSMLWIWSGRETLGMRWTKLRLIDFDGLPAARRERILRIAGACLSCCAGGVGLLWALVDEEKLTWHDHISKTFPTPQESDSPFTRSR